MMIRRFSVSMLIAMILAGIHLMATFASVVLLMSLVYGENYSEWMDSSVNALDLFRGLLAAGVFISILVHTMGFDKSKPKETAEVQSFR